MRDLRRLGRAAIVLFVAGCQMPPADDGGGPPAPGTAKDNCMAEIAWRSGGTARFVSVTEDSNGVSVVKAAGFWGRRWICFANPEGKPVRVRFDGGWR